MLRNCQPGHAAWSLIALAVTWGAAAETSEPQPTSGGSVRHEAIAELVAANHVLAKLGVLDGFGHVTIRDPDYPQRYLMSRSLAPALVIDRDIMQFDLDSNPLDAGGRAAAFER